MRLASAASLLVLLAIFAPNAADAAVSTFFLSPQGNDSNPGTATQPFLTVARAQAAVRALKAKNGGALLAPVSVLFASGTYHIDQPLEFGAEDSGAKASPVTYIAQPGASVVISGGASVHGWTDTTIAVPQPNGGVNKVAAFTAQLPAGTKPFRQLWINGTRRTLARTPVMAYAKASTTAIVAQPGQIPTTSPVNPDLVTVVLYESWTASVHQIASIDAATLTVNLKTKYNDQWSGSAAGSRYYFQNMLEALDTPGEFYYDPTKRELTYLPLPGETAASIDAVVPQLVELVQGAGTFGTGVAPAFLEYVSFVNIAFQHSMVDVSTCFASSCDGQSGSFLTTATLRFNTSRFINLANVSVAHTGGYGVWFNKAAFNNTIHGCHLYDLGAGAVRLGPPQSGVEATATARNVGNVVSDSVLEDGGHYYKEGCGVLAQQVVEASVVHNNISYFRYTGVSVGWTWGYAATSVHSNIVGWNYIHHIALDELSDLGCVYTLGVQPGTTIINNVCHDVWSFNYGGWGYYTDEGSSNITNTHNLVYDTKCAGYHQHYGVDNLMFNNVVGDVNQGNCDGAVRSSQHPGKCVWPSVGESQGRCSSFTFDTNIVYQPNGTMLMATIPSGFMNMSFSHNTYWRLEDASTIQFPTNTSDHSFAEWQHEGKDVASAIANPQFVNAQGNDWTQLAATSPAIVKEGFTPIDISTVGPRRAGLHRHLAAAAAAPAAFPQELAADARAVHKRAFQGRDAAREAATAARAA